MVKVTHEAVEPIIPSWVNHPRHYLITSETYRYTKMYRSLLLCRGEEIKHSEILFLTQQNSLDTSNSNVGWYDKTCLLQY